MHNRTMYADDDELILEDGKPKLTIAKVFKAILARIVLIIHGTVVIWRLTIVKQNSLYYGLCSFAAGLAIEVYVTFHYKRGEWKWVSLCIAIYLIAIIPAVWIMEIDVNNGKRFICSHSHFNNTGYKSFLKCPNESSMTEERNLYESHYDEAPVWLYEISKTAEDGEVLVKTMEERETWIRVLEQTIFVVLIICRWLLPKGGLTRDQQAQLLLANITMTADILELFEVFKESIVVDKEAIVLATLGIWTLSMTQFVLKLTTTRKTDKHEKDWNCCTWCFATEVWAMSVELILQDIPFLTLRLILIIHFEVFSQGNIFFTSKNLLVICLQTYRLIILLLQRNITITPIIQKQFSKKKKLIGMEGLAKNFNQGVAAIAGGYDDLEESTKKKRRRRKYAKEPGDVMWGWLLDGGNKCHECNKRDINAPDPQLTDYMEEIKLRLTGKLL